VEKRERFTLQAGQWYALEVIGDHSTGNAAAFSPIRIHAVVPLHSGQRRFELRFYHANYPEGVRDKKYLLETIERAADYLLARRLGEPAQIVLIHGISWRWVRAHFRVSEDTDDLEMWLRRHA
jgi:hypothetical protein